MRDYISYIKNNRLITKILNIILVMFILCVMIQLFSVEQNKDKDKSVKASPETEVSMDNIVLSQTGTHIFKSAEEGYSAVDSIEVTVANYNDVVIQNVNVRLETDGEEFYMNTDKLSETTSTSIDSIAKAGKGSFFVVPKKGLGVGVHRAKVKVCVDGCTEMKEFDVVFRVYSSVTIDDKDYYIYCKDGTLYKKDSNGDSSLTSSDYTGSIEVAYDEGTGINTITLDNFSFTTKGQYGLYVQGDAVIKLKGTSFIACSHESNANSDALHITGDATIEDAGSGDGSLEVRGGMTSAAKTEGIYVEYGNLTINSGDIVSNVFNGASAYNGIAAEGNIYINGGTVWAESGCNNGDAIYAKNSSGEINITGGSVTAIGYGSTGSSGIYGENDVNISGGTVETITYGGNNSCAIAARNNINIEETNGKNPTSISGCTQNNNAYSTIWGQNSVTIEGGKIRGTTIANHSFIEGENNLKISGGDIEATIIENNSSGLNSADISIACGVIRLNIIGNNSEAIYCTGGIDITGGYIYARAEGDGCTGIYGIIGINISGGEIYASAIGQGYCNGILAKEGSIHITDGCINVYRCGENGSNSNGNGIYGYNGILIDDGVVNAVVKDGGGNESAIWAVNEYESTNSAVIINGGTVYASTDGPHGDGITAERAGITINGGRIFVEGTKDNCSGIWSDSGSINILGGEVIATSEKTCAIGVKSSNSITIANCMVKATSNADSLYSIYRESGTVSIDNATVIAQGNDNNSAFYGKPTITDSKVVYAVNSENNISKAEPESSGLAWDYKYTYVKIVPTKTVLDVSQKEDYTFRTEKESYSSTDDLVFTVTNTNGVDVTGLSVSLEGTAASSFKVYQVYNERIEESSTFELTKHTTAKFVIRPNNSLTQGTYNATVKISDTSNNVKTEKFNITFNVISPIELKDFYITCKAGKLYKNNSNEELTESDLTGLSDMIKVDYVNGKETITLNNFKFNTSAKYGLVIDDTEAIIRLGGDNYVSCIYTINNENTIGNAIRANGKLTIENDWNIGGRGVLEVIGGNENYHYTEGIHSEKNIIIRSGKVSIFSSAYTVENDTCRGAICGDNVYISGGKVYAKVSGDCGCAILARSDDDTQRNGIIRISGGMVTAVGNDIVSSSSDSNIAIFGQYGVEITGGIVNAMSYSGEGSGIRAESCYVNISASNKIGTIVNAITVNPTENFSALDANNGVVNITGGYVTTEVTGNSSNGICGYKGVNIDGGRIETVALGDCSVGMYGYGDNDDINISGGDIYIKVAGYDTSGIYSKRGYIHISSGNIIVDSEGDNTSGIYSSCDEYDEYSVTKVPEGDLHITGGKIYVTAEGTSSLSIKGNDVEIGDGTISVYTKGDNKIYGICGNNYIDISYAAITSKIYRVDTDNYNSCALYAKNGIYMEGGYVEAIAKGSHEAGQKGGAAIYSDNERAYGEGIIIEDGTVNAGIDIEGGTAIATDADSIVAIKGGIVNAYGMGTNNDVISSGKGIVIKGGYVDAISNTSYGIVSDGYIDIKNCTVKAKKTSSGDPQSVIYSFDNITITNATVEVDGRSADTVAIMSKPSITNSKLVKVIKDDGTDETNPSGIIWNDADVYTYVKIVPDSVELDVSQKQDYRFTSEQVGYSLISGLSVDINNRSGKDVSNVKVEITGTDADKFVLTTDDSGNVINSNNLITTGDLAASTGETRFNVKPVQDLEKGNYEATIKIHDDGNDVKSVEFNVYFSVYSNVVSDNYYISCKEGTLYVNASSDGNQLDSSIFGDKITASKDAEGKTTITLKDFCFSTTATYGIYIEDTDVELQLEGNNYIKSDGSDSNAIHALNNLTISGTGYLETIGKKSGIYDDRELTINSGSINAKGNTYGIRGTQAVIINGGKVEANSSYAVYSYYLFKLNDGCVKATSTFIGIHVREAGSVDINGGQLDILVKGNNMAGIYTFNSPVNIRDGIVNVNSIGGSPDGIGAERHPITISGGTVNVHVQGNNGKTNDGKAIVCNNSDIIISGGNVKVDVNGTNSNTIYAVNNLIIKGGVVESSVYGSSGAALYSPNNINIIGGDIIANAVGTDSYGIKADKQLTISGGAISTKSEDNCAIYLSNPSSPTDTVTLETDYYNMGIIKASKIYREAYVDLDMVNSPVIDDLSLYKYISIGGDACFNFRYDASKGKMYRVSKSGVVESTPLNNGEIVPGWSIVDGTLVLDGFDFTTTSRRGLEVINGTANIQLAEGSINSINTIVNDMNLDFKFNNETDKYRDIVICAYKNDIVIKGNGALNLYAKINEDLAQKESIIGIDGILSDKNITVAGGNININCQGQYFTNLKSRGIYANNITINKGDLVINALGTEVRGIYAYNKLNIPETYTGNITSTTEGDDNYNIGAGYEVNIQGGKITLNSTGTAVATLVTNEDYRCYGIYVKDSTASIKQAAFIGSDDTSNGLELTIMCKGIQKVRGIYSASYTKDIVIKNCNNIDIDIIQEGDYKETRFYNYGIYSYYGMEISNSKIDIDLNIDKDIYSYGICSNPEVDIDTGETDAKLSITGSTLTIDENQSQEKGRGIHSKYAAMEISDSKIEIKVDGRALISDATDKFTIDGSILASTDKTGNGAKYVDIEAIISNMSGSLSRTKYVKIGEKIMTVDISWGDMDYMYTEGSWNPSNLSYDEGIWSPIDTTNGDKIIVDNSGSNVPIKATITYTPETAYSYISGQIKEKTTNTVLTANQKIAIRGKLDAYLSLTGSLPSSTPSKTNLGSLTVTLNDYK